MTTQIQNSHSQDRLLKVLLAPVVSEKSTLLSEKNNQVVFRVASDACKPEIQAAVELLFKVKVSGVQIVNVKGKVKRSGKRIGQRKNWKKAYVSLVQGQDLDLLANG